MSWARGGIPLSSNTEIGSFSFTYHRHYFRRWARPRSSLIESGPARKGSARRVD